MSTGGIPAVRAELADAEQRLIDAAARFGDGRVTLGEYMAERGPLADRVAAARSHKHAFDRTVREHTDWLATAWPHMSRGQRARAAAVLNGEPPG